MAYRRGMEGPGGADLAMVAAELRARDRERWLSCLWAEPEVRPALVAVHALDAEFGRIAAEIREPLLAEIRLAWWREQLVRLSGGAPPPPQPLLRLLARERGRLDLARLAELEGAFLPLLAGPLAGGARSAGAQEELAAHVRARGAGLFEALLVAFGRRSAGDAARQAARRAGEAWALADAARRQAVPPAGVQACLSAPHGLGRAEARCLPRPLRALAALAFADCAALASGRPLAPQATAGRQLRMARAALLA